MKPPMNKTYHGTKNRMEHVLHGSMLGLSSSLRISTAEHVLFIYSKIVDNTYIVACANTTCNMQAVPSCSASFPK